MSGLKNDYLKTSSRKYTVAKLIHEKYGSKLLHSTEEKRPS